MQTIAGVVPVEADGSFSPFTYMPVGVERVRLLRPLVAPKYCYAVRTSPDNQPSPESVTANAYVLDENGDVLVEFHQVTVQRIGSIDDGSGEDVHDWFYQIAWENKPLVMSPADSARAGNFLLLADDAGVAEELAGRLAADGATCIQVVPGEAFARPASGDEPYTVRPTSAEDFAELLRQTCGEGEATCAGIVHCWGLRSDNPEDDGEAAWEKARDLGCASALRLIQQVARGRFVSPPPIWLVTRAAQMVGAGRGIAVQQAPLWGMGRVAAMEHPELACRLVDLDPNATASASSTSLFSEIAGGSDENQIAYRGGERFVARLQTAAHVDEPDTAGHGLTVPSDGDFPIADYGHRQL